MSSVREEIAPVGQPLQLHATDRVAPATDALHMRARVELITPAAQRLRARAPGKSFLKLLILLPILLFLRGIGRFLRIPCPSAHTQRAPDQASRVRRLSREDQRENKNM